MAKPASSADAAEKEAAANLAEAQAALQEAAERTAEAGQGLIAVKMQKVPEMVFELHPGQHISHNDKAYYGEGYTHAPEGHEGNDDVTLDGPTAIALMQMGYGHIKGAAA